MSKKSSKPIRSEAELAELRKRGRELYLTYVPFNDIAKELCVSASTLSDWRKSAGWEIERDGIERGILEDAFGARRMTVSRIVKTTTDVLERGLQAIANRVEPITLAEAERLSVILGNLDKILRLDTNRPTDNIQIASTVTHTVEDIRARLAADPVLGMAIEAASVPKVYQPGLVASTQQPVELRDE
jgi:hypothetical protein